MTEDKSVQTEAFLLYHKPLRQLNIQDMSKAEIMSRLKTSISKLPAPCNKNVYLKRMVNKIRNVEKVNRSMKQYTSKDVLYFNMCTKIHRFRVDGVIKSPIKFFFFLLDSNFLHIKNFFEIDLCIRKNSECTFDIKTHFGISEKEQLPVSDLKLQNKYSITITPKTGRICTVNLNNVPICNVFSEKHCFLMSTVKNNVYYS